MAQTPTEKKCGRCVGDYMHRQEAFLSDRSGSVREGSVRGMRTLQMTWKMPRKPFWACFLGETQASCWCE